MTQSTPPRKLGRPAIPLDRIVESAMEIVDESGPTALSLRTLADRLSSSTSTLYRHVSGRAELIGLVVDRMLGEALSGVGESPSDSWETICRRSATSTFEVLSRHGGAAALLADEVPIGPNAMALREGMLKVLLGNGFEPEHAIRIVATIGHYVIGFAMQAPRRRAQDHSDAVKSMDGEAYPMTAVVAEYMPRPLTEEFGYGLDLLIWGIVHERREAATSAKPR